MERNLLYYVQFNEDTSSEGRVFFEGVNYPVYEKKEGYVTLCAENGEFNFSDELMNRVVNEWNLVFIKKESVEHD